MSVDKITLNEMAVGKMSADEMIVGKLTITPNTWHVLLPLLPMSNTLGKG